LVVADPVVGIAAGASAGLATGFTLAAIIALALTIAAYLPLLPRTDAGDASPRM
jgi:hypothetical protein